MARWQLIDENWNFEVWDDGLPYKPGEPGFTTSLVIAYANGRDFNYIDTPNWVPPAELVEDDEEEQ